MGAYGSMLGEGRMDNLWFWTAGNVVLPLLPVLITAVVLKVAGRTPSWISAAGELIFLESLLDQDWVILVPDYESQDDA